MKGAAVGAAAWSGIFGTQIDRVMELARRHLEMDVVLLSEFSDGKQIYRALEGAGETFGFAVGGSRPLATTYCQSVVTGEIPNVIPDTAADDRVRDLAVTRESRIGSYIAVPLSLPDGTLYGTLCGLSHDPKGLNSRDAHFMSMLAELVVDELDAQRTRDRRREGIAGLINDERLRLALQPIVSLHTGACLGVEALSRFPSGFGGPDVVFATAQQVGLDLQLERLAVVHALGLLPRLAPEQFLAVNLSPSVALDLGLDVIAKTEPILDRLVLEITEHAAITGYAQLRERLQPYRDRGLRLAIDDAGAGYASLHHVVELEPDIIKIDRSLINGVATDRGRRSVVSALVLLALDLRAMVVAEGIETRDDFYAAYDLGVDAAQGYLLARPSTDRRVQARWSNDTIMLPDRSIDAAVKAPPARIRERRTSAHAGPDVASEVPAADVRAIQLTG